MGSTVPIKSVLFKFEFEPTTTENVVQRWLSENYFGLKVRTGLIGFIS